ncbi:hypothetical protein BD770DRAFT_408820 [Pilaira anomala]|nr:hypothetical protein BD770DRAFT_408820 [Pilaira anomala]
MDFIKLERIEPFQKPAKRPTAPKAKSKAKAKPKPKPVPQGPRIATFNAEEYQGVHSDLNSRFGRLRTSIYEPLPIPPQVIPTMAFLQQINTYESIFFQPGDKVDNLNMKTLVSPFSEISNPPVSSKSAQHGKILFLTKLLVKINKADMNYDPAIICCDQKSEQRMRNHLFASNFNVRALSEMFPKHEIYGVIVKIRKNIKITREFTPITRAEVDSIFVYDSACVGNVDKELRYLKGIGKRTQPIIFYIACMDTIEMRIHTYNRCSPDHVNWNTKVGSLTHDLQQSLLLQPNRRPNHIATVAWNDYLAQTVFNWIVAKESREYIFKFPSKGVLHLEVNSFLLHHPYTESSLGNNKQAAATRPPVPKNRVSGAAVASTSNPSSAAKTAVTPIPIPNHRQETSNASTRSAGSFVKPAIRPDVIPGIHPDRMIMINSDRDLNTIGQKRQRDCEVEVVEEQPISKKASKLPAASPLPPIEPEREEQAPVEPVATAEAEASSSTVATKEADVPKQAKSLVTDLTTKFNNFFANALKKFESDIRDIQKL